MLLNRFQLKPPFLLLLSSALLLLSSALLSLVLLSLVLLSLVLVSLVWCWCHWCCCRWCYWNERGSITCEPRRGSYTRFFFILTPFKDIPISAILINFFICPALAEFNLLSIFWSLLRFDEKLSKWTKPASFMFIFRSFHNGKTIIAQV